MELGFKNFLNVNTANASDLNYQEIYLNSSERMRSGGTNNNPTWTLTNGMKVEYIKLKSINLPCSWFNVNNTNNEFQIQEEGNQPVNIVIPEGVYTTFDELKTPIVDIINANTHVDDLYTLDIQNNGLLVIGTSNPQHRFKFIFDNDNFSTNRLLGFGDVKDTGFNVDNHLHARDPPQLHTLESLFLVSRSLRGSVIVPKCNLGGVMAKIPLTGPDGAFQWSDFSGSTYDFQKIDTLVTEIQLELIDAQTLKPVDLRGVNWSCVLSIFT